MIKAEVKGTGIANPSFDGWEGALLRQKFRNEINGYTFFRTWTNGFIGHIKANVPPGLEKLRESVHFDADAPNHPERSVAGEHTAGVAIDDPAARFVEYGTPDTPARPFVRPAIEESKREMRAWAKWQGTKIIFRVLLKILTLGASR